MKSNNNNNKIPMNNDDKNEKSGHACETEWSLLLIDYTGGTTHCTTEKKIYYVDSRRWLGISSKENQQQQQQQEITASNQSSSYFIEGDSPTPGYQPSPPRDKRKKEEEKKQPIVQKIPFNQIKSKKISISTINVIIEKTVHYESPSDRRICSYKFMESEKQALIKLTSQCDIYLMTMIEDDSEEDKIKSILKDSGIFDNGLNPHKILFCSTTQGRAHMSRHLECLMHIDDDYQVLSMLKPHVQHLLHIDDGNNTTSTTSTSTANNSASSVVVPTNNNQQQQGKFSISATPSLHEYFN
ncbi:splicing factor [Cavenderia fasciculata]|uniref:Splicing factor n=1 Tax=Cavenderia fasciculata TaxID=261658 RepID=F4PJN4_CACFS|nr:splicing factor [Cavenderia fasciculata]EGG23808.1 splicing factor [Cavenderia fasciculata]|eukprot:XP_004361659.1 splicing factor [Cavenderia fasciculata]